MNYENGKCEVTFTLKNNEYNERSRKVRIVAHRQSNIGKGAVVNDILGEKTFLVYLKPREKKEITETVDLFPNLRPTIVIVRHFEAK